MDKDLPALRSQAEALLDSKNLVEAEALYRQLVDAASDVHDQHQLGVVLFQQGRHRYAEAIERFKKAHELWLERGSEDRKFALYNWANTLRLSGELSEAEQVCRRALAVDDSYAHAHNLLGLILEAQGPGRYAKAVKQFDRAAELWAKEGSEKRSYALSDAAELLRLQEKFAEAEARCRDAIVAKPDHANAYNILGLVLQAQGKEKYAAAVEAFEKASELWAAQGSVARSLALTNWAETLRRSDRLAEAEAKCRESIAVDGSFANAYNILGLVLKAHGKGSYAAAIEQFTKAADLWRKQGSQDRRYSLATAAELLRLQDRLAEAEALCLQAIAVDETYAYAHNTMGLVLRGQGKRRYPNALEHFEKAEKLWTKENSTDRRFALENVAETLRLMERLPEAEAKCREAIALDQSYPGPHHTLGYVLRDQGPDKYPAAIEQLRKAAELWSKMGSAERKYALRSWASLLGNMEDHEQAVEKAKLAVDADPTDPDSYFDLGYVLGDFGQYQESLNAYDKVLRLDPTQPYAHHNKANHEFYLGRYVDGWKSWERAKTLYEEATGHGLDSALQAERAVHYAAVLSEYFADREGAQRLYKAVLEHDPGNHAAWAGLASMYCQWVAAEKPSPTAMAMLPYTLKRAFESLKSRLGKGDDWQNFIALADLCLEADHLVEAEEWLSRARALDESPSRRAQVASRLGVLRAKQEQFEKAAEHFSESLRIEPGNLKARTNLGEALLKCKKLERARGEFGKVLSTAKGNIEALIGCAQTCIEMAESGDGDHWAQAEENLSAAIQHGVRESSGSKRLAGKELAKVYYLLGYVRVRRYEADGGSGNLSEAEVNFRDCKEIDPTYHKADAALQKLRARRLKEKRDTVFDWLGPLVVCLAAAAVFALALLDFFFAGREFIGLKIQGQSKISSGYYALFAFGSIVFMVAGLYLPKVLKLKVGAIELEKTSVEQISTPTGLGISR